MRRIAPIPRALEHRTKDPHPIEDAQLQADVRAWTVVILGVTGTGKVTLEFDFKDWTCRGVRLGGNTSRTR